MRASICWYSSMGDHCCCWLVWLNLSHCVAELDLSLPRCSFCCTCCGFYYGTLFSFLASAPLLLPPLVEYVSSSFWFRVAYDVSVVKFVDWLLKLVWVLFAPPLFGCCCCWLFMSAMSLSLCSRWFKLLLSRFWMILPVPLCGLWGSSRIAACKDGWSWGYGNCWMG